jgi:putative DNA primase/helicase
VRIVDIHADAGAGFGIFNHAGPHSDAQKLADAIKNAACTFYGTAGPAFLEGIVAEGLDAIAAALHQAQKKFRSNAEIVPADANGQVLRVADRFSLVAFAGELAIGLGIVPWPAGAVLTAAQRLFVAWLDQRGGIEPAEILAGIEQVKKFIEQYGSSRFDPSDGTDRPVHDRLGWRKGEGQEQEWLIPPAVWKDPVCRGHNPTLVARSLAERGMLARGEAKNLAKNEWVEGRSRRVYVLTAKIAGDAP